ncbi:glycoside hydrolase family 76 protein [Amylocarpus encephaloides]|uniref:Glycoside hydrolase family 76 protein n=1 Tax=Amylocarpus encephaloides TaxID=45428 RepID=A0A9P7YPI0_9HELO|nr:glycoside hydrolase family 76 protein [Amylocarpus encephaloides]
MFSFRAVHVLAVLSLSLDFSSALPAPTSPVPQHFQIGHRLTSRATKQDYVAYSAAGFNQMQTWYSASTGIWGDVSHWWNSANVITTMANFQEYFNDQIAPTTKSVFPTTLTQAPIASGNTGFLNTFYDDELWWVLAWIKVYDVTKEQKYLDMAAQIFEDPKNVWGQATCGGLWWDKAHTQNGAVENELYLTAAAKLANRLPSTPSEGYYYTEALKAYRWFISSGLINSDNLINNGLDLTTCKNDGTVVFTYNQGILLSGLAELTWASGDQSYTDLANTLALAGMDSMTDSNGVLHEQCEPDACGKDLQQFKGIFGRNIQFLYNRATGVPEATRTRYRDFLRANADSIWAYDQVDNQLGLVWSGPSSMATIETQSSALDAIVGAACVS